MLKSAFAGHAQFQLVSSYAKSVWETNGPALGPYLFKSAFAGRAQFQLASSYAKSVWETNVSKHYLTSLVD